MGGGVLVSCVVELGFNHEGHNVILIIRLFFVILHIYSGIIFVPV